MDSIVQLIRNALCVCKDLQLFSSSFLYDTSIVQKYYKLSYPYNLTTPIDVLISIVQFYVVFSGVPSSIQLMITSYKKIQQIKHLSTIEDTNFTTKKSKDPNYTITPCNRIIRISLYNEGTNATRSFYIGFNCFFISLSFIWLGCNSWHITETSVIGGIQGLIHALSVMNICLTPLLYYMIKDHRMYFSKVEQMELTVQILKEQIESISNNSTTSTGTTKNTKKKSTTTEESTPKIVTDPTKLLYDENNIEMIDFDILATSCNGGWKPFWSNDTNNTIVVATSATTTGTRSLLSMDDTSGKMDLERTKVQDIIDIFCKGIDPTSSLSTNGSTTTPVNTQKRVELVQETINDMEDNIEIIRFYGYRELLYFVINFIAWYGYGLCILVYYYKNIIVNERTIWENRIFLYMDNNLADYYGNLVGDCMWTIEPIIALFSPYYITELRQRAKVIKEYQLVKKNKDTNKSTTNTKTKKTQ